MAGDLEGGALVPAGTDPMMPVPRAPAVQQGVVGMAAQTDGTRAVTSLKPREPKEALSGVLKEAPFAGASWYYSWPVKNKGQKAPPVEGPSIGLALAVMRHWRNLILNVRVESETAEYWDIRVEVTDLESGNTIPRLFRQPKRTAAGGSFDADRALQMAFAIGQSKATRNVLIRGGLPEWLVKRAMAAAKAAVTKGAVDQDGKVTTDARTEILAGFSRYDVTLRRLEESVGKGIDEWDGETVAHFMGLLQALEDGQVSLKDAFPPPQAEADGAVLRSDENRPAQAADSPQQGTQGQQAAPAAAPAEEPDKLATRAIQNEIRRLAQALRIPAEGDGSLADLCAGAGLAFPPETQRQAEAVVRMLGQRAQQGNGPLV